VVKDREDGAGDESHRVRALRRRSKKHCRIRAVSPIRLEVVFDGTDMGIAIAFAQLDQVEGFTKILLARLHLRTHVREKIKSKLHTSLLPLPTATYYAVRIS